MHPMIGLFVFTQLDLLRPCGGFWGCCKHA